MLRMRRCRNIQTLLYLLLGVSGFTYFFLYDDIARPASSLAARKIKYASRATYEYNSVYRLHADRAFEDSLDSQLLALEQSIISSQDLKSDLAVHQIADPLSAAKFSTWVNQWRTNNPGWGHDLLTTHPASLLSLYSDMPSIAYSYHTYPPIQSDLTRYLMLWYYGGLYTDIDTWERVSLKDCSQIVEAQARDVGLMIGVERDEPFFSWDEIRGRGWTRGFGFGTGTMWAPKRFDPILRRAIVRSVSHATVQQTLGGGDSWRASFRGTNKWGEEERGEISGAGMFTDIVIEVLSEALKEEHELRDRDAGLARRVSWKKFKGLKSTLWIEPSHAKDSLHMRGVAVLPINVWSNGQNHSSSGAADSEGVCVNHVYGERAKRKGWSKGSDNDTNFEFILFPWLLGFMISSKSLSTALSCYSANGMPFLEGWSKTINTQKKKSLQKPPPWISLSRKRIESRSHATK